MMALSLDQLDEIWTACIYFKLTTYKDLRISLSMTYSKSIINLSQSTDNSITEFAIIKTRDKNNVLVSNVLMVHDIKV
jgi:uncharacterized ubiquitin-like protein YukD